MRRFFAAIMALSIAVQPLSALENEEQTWSIAIHGGAGVIKRANLSAEREAAIRAKLDEALAKGSEILKSGGTSMDAITATIMILENDPNFNAGKGAVFTWDGKNELDTSIMDGKTRNAGAAAGVQYTKNPILLARAVMENSRHVLLSGAGADQFSREQGLEQVDPSYFYTQSRYDSLQRYKAAQTKREAEKAAAKTSSIDLKNDTVGVDALGRDYRFGTVGAVAVDKDGNIAAGTSTGGTTGKRWGRVGDSPIIGAGTYADNRSCGISATGTGEYFIRLAVAQEICSRLRFERIERYKLFVNGVLPLILPINKIEDEDFQQIQEKVKTLDKDIIIASIVDIMSQSDDKQHKSIFRNKTDIENTERFLFQQFAQIELNNDDVQVIIDSVIAELGDIGGDGGIIYVTPFGHSGFSFNTEGMYRARGDSNGTKVIAIYGDE